MVDKGKLAFSNLEGLENDDKLKEMKQQWDAFLDTEEEEKKRYFRSLEIDFSLNALADENQEAEIKDAIASVLSDKKIEEQSEALKTELRRFKNFLSRE